MKELASRSDFESYLTKFQAIFKRVLRPNVTCEADAIVSDKDGALIFLEFKMHGEGKLRYKQIDKPIAIALQNLPQKAFGGDLSGVKFEGKNVIVEGNRLIIIKGDNSKTAWSQEAAVKDAIEEVNRIASLPTR